MRRTDLCLLFPSELEYSPHPEDSKETKLSLVNDLFGTENGTQPVIEIDEIISVWTRVFPSNSEDIPPSSTINPPKVYLDSKAPCKDWETFVPSLDLCLPANNCYPYPDCSHQPTLSPEEKRSATSTTKSPVVYAP